jgi:hypothetical protein
MFLALLVGAGLLLVSVLCYAVATDLIIGVVVRLTRGGFIDGGRWKNVAAMMVVTLITAAAHLVLIALWAAALLLCGEMDTFDRAFYCSAENYTALGYGDVVLSERWRLLGPLEAVNGLLLFGLSTAVMFAVLSRLITSRLRRQAADVPTTPDPLRTEP